ncbi:MAG: hypothetical protein V4795_07415 [Pseudomonadota bacterium]
MDAALQEEFARLHGGTPAPAPAPAPDPAAPQPMDAGASYNSLVDGLDDERAPAALCLSGGGIRSATFCLGAIQGLARVGLLGRFHYLSMVSGGGYIGAWLSAWIQRAGLPAVVQSLAGWRTLAGSATAAPHSPTPVDRLRAYTNYLSPVWGLSIDALTLAAIFLRNLFLHWAVWLPWLAALLLLPRLQLSLQLQAPGWPVLLAVFLVSGLLIGAAVTYIATDLPGELSAEAQQDKTRQPRNRFAALCMPALFAAALLLSWVAAWLAHPTLADTTDRLRSWPVALGCVAAGAALHVAAAGVGWWLRPRRGLTRRRYTYPKRAFLAAISTGGLGGLLLFCFLAGASQLPLHADPAGAAGQPELLLLYTLLAVPALLSVFWLAVTVYVGSMGRLTSEEDREWWSRSSAVSLSWSLGWAIVVLLVLLLPYWILQLPWLRSLPSPEPALGGFTAVLGGLISLAGFWSKRGPALKQQIDGVVSRLGAHLLEAAALVFIVLLVVAGSLTASWVLDRLPLQDSADGVSAHARRDRQVAQALQARAAQDQQKAQRAQQARQAQPATASCTQPARPCPPQDAATPRDPALRFALVLAQIPAWCIGAAAAGLALFGLAAMRTMGVNTFSLHAMYGNRLVRAYLGASRVVRQPHWFTGFDPNDNLPMAALTVAQQRLFPVVNIALNLAEAAGGRLEWQQRKAASFTVTPLRSGSPHLGFVATRAYGRAPRSVDPARPRHPAADALEPTVDQSLGGITLGRAMATSGAAASPNMGYHTSKLVAFAMSFFNVRLGWWLPNPRPQHAAHWTTDDPPFGLWNMVAEAAAQTSAERPFVHLSDGGHFENLGLYEMVRRRCRRIVVIDATADPTYSYADLESSIRKIRIDLGAEVAFDRGLPTAESVRRTGCHFAVGQVRYPDAARSSTIIYFKPALSGDEPLDVTRYAKSQRRRGAAFPHDPTSHQNFDEAQFESYRMLGWHSVIGAFVQGSPWELVARPDHRPPPAPPSGGVPATGTGAAGADKTTASGGLLQLAAATLVGTAAITGTVALKDPVVTLKNPEVQLRGDSIALREGSTVALADRTLQVDAELQAALEALARGIGGPEGAALAEARTLVRAIDDLRQALQRQPDTGPLQVQIDQLRLELQRRQNTTELKVGVEMPLDLRNNLAGVAVAMNRAALAMERAASQPDPHAAEVVAALRAIERAVRATAPRNNVSGTTDAGRP